MIEFRTLGTLGLTVNGREVPSLLTQPRRLALLAYLAAATPRGFHRRDRLLTLFWPDLDQEHARAALRQALHVIRTSLGAEVLLARGDEEIGVSPEHLWCDVVEFERLASDKAVAEALALYSGPFLDGFFISEAPEFERWLESERARLDEEARGCARAQVTALETRGDLAAAADAARQATQLWPMEEELIRRFITVLDARGDRAGAAKAFEEFRARLAAEYEVEPAAETHALMEAVRAREVTGVTPRLLAPIPEPEATEAAMSRRRSRMGFAAAAGVGTLVLIGFAAVRLVHGHSPDPSRVVVADLENRTGDSSWTALGQLASDWISRELLHTGMVEVADRGLNQVSDQRLALATAGTTVEGAYYQRGDSLEFEARVTDQVHGKVLRTVEPVAGPASDPRAAIVKLSERITAALATVVNPKLADLGNLVSQPPTYEAYRELALGADAWFDRLDANEAIPHFLLAARLDTTYTLPLIWAAWAYRALSRCDLVDSVGRVLNTRGPWVPAEKYIFERESAFCHGDKLAAYRASQHLAAAVPGSEIAGVSFARDLLYVDRPRQALALLNELHPDRAPLRTFTPYFYLVTSAYHMLGAHEQELASARRARHTVPDNLATLRTEIIALAALGRVKEVLEDFAEIPNLPQHAFRAPGDVMLEAALELRAHGQTQAGRDVLQRVLTWDRDRPSEDRAGEAARFLRLRILFAAEEWSLARAVAESLATEHPDQVNYQGLRGAVAARLADTVEARRVDILLATRQGTPARGPVAYWRACILAQLDRRAEALERLTQAEDWGIERGRNAGGYWFMQLHTDPCFDTLHDLPGFKSLLEPKG